MFRVIRDNVVDCVQIERVQQASSCLLPSRESQLTVVIILPPADREASGQVCQRNPKTIVQAQRVRHTAVSQVMCHKSHLPPQNRRAKGTEEHREERSAKEDDGSDHSRQEKASFRNFPVVERAKESVIDCIENVGSARIAVDCRKAPGPLVSLVETHVSNLPLQLQICFRDRLKIRHRLLLVLLDLLRTRSTFRATWKSFETKHIDTTLKSPKLTT